MRAVLIDHCFVIAAVGTFFQPLFHAANFFTTQGYAGEEGLPYNNAWVILLLLVVVLLGTATLWGYLRDCYEWKGSILDAAS